MWKINLRYIQISRTNEQKESPNFNQRDKKKEWSISGLHREIVPYTYAPVCCFCLSTHKNINCTAKNWRPFLFLRLRIFLRGFIFGGQWVFIFMPKTFFSLALLLLPLPMLRYSMLNGMRRRKKKTTFPNEN